MNSKYRTLYFLLGTLGVGLLLVFGLYIFSFSPNPQAVAKKELASAGHGHLESKIHNMSLKNFNPGVYNTLLIEINTGHDQKLFNADIQKMLKDRLDKNYQDLAYQKLNNLLAAVSLDYGQINTIMQHLETTFGNNNKLASTKSKLKAIVYYSNTLPTKVNAFISSGFGSFEDDQYAALKRELATVPAEIKQRQSVNASINQSTQKLNKHYADYQQWYSEVM